MYTSRALVGIIKRATLSGLLAGLGPGHCDAADEHDDDEKTLAIVIGRRVIMLMMPARPGLRLSRAEETNSAVCIAPPLESLGAARFTLPPTRSGLWAVGSARD